jgi:multidrug efflux pump subunit AcrB
MNSITTIIISILSSSVVATVMSAFMQKRNEKEQRIFNAKLEAYREFAAHLESRFISLVKHGQSLDITVLAEVSAKCLLVSSSDLNKKLKVFLTYVSEVYKKCSDNNEKEFDFKKLWENADEIEGLMREDLGFK